jgi:putative addiction module component (TIGR02574 family)
MTTATLEEKVLKLPPASRVRLAEKLLQSVDDYVSPEIASSWEREIARRSREIESGRVKGIPADEVFAEARRRLHEARGLSSSRRKRAH